MTSFSALFGGFLRWLVTILLTWLAAKKIISAEQANDATVLTVVAWLTPLLVPLLWSFYQKLAALFHLNVALALPPGATKEDVEVVKAEASTKQVLSTEAPPPNEIAKALDRKIRYD